MSGSRRQSGLLLVLGDGLASETLNS